MLQSCCCCAWWGCCGGNCSEQTRGGSEGGQEKCSRGGWEGGCTRACWVSSDSILVYDSPPGTWNVVCNALIQAQRSGREQESQHHVHGDSGKHKEEERKVTWEDEGRNDDDVMIVYIDIKFNWMIWGCFSNSSYISISISMYTLRNANTKQSIFWFPPATAIVSVLDGRISGTKRATGDLLV